MTESTIAQAAFISSVFALFGVFAWMPVTRGPRAFFGVRVETGYFDGAGKRVLFRYRLVLAAVFFLIIAIAAALRPLGGDPVVLVAAELLLAAAAFVFYMRFASAVRPHASTGGATRFAASTRVRSARERMWLDAIVATLAAVAFAAPAILLIPALGAYLQFFFYVLRHDFAEAKMTLPADSTDEYLAAKEQVLQTNIDTVDWVRLTIAVTFCGLALWQTSAAVSRASVFLGAAALVGGITFLLVRMIRINARLRRQTGNDYAQRAVDESHWRHGGLTYSNPDDPALVVEKLVGVGYTLNMAHPGIRTRLLLLAAFPVFVIWAVLAI
jgi:uncharacterized membrane protein